MSVNAEQPAPFGVRPDSRGRFGEFGGQYVPETLMPALAELASEFDAAWADPSFRQSFDHYLAEYVGRPTPITFLSRISQEVGCQVYAKREDLCHTGAHKINNALGQCLLALRMGKKRIIAETGAGQHGVATATVCAKFGLQCVVYMGEEDTVRQRLNVVRMKLLGAEVRSVSTGTKTLKDAMNEAMRDWVTNVESTHYIIGSAAGPHPYPYLVRELQSVISKEARSQFIELKGQLPDWGIACVGGGSNAIGFFASFLNDKGMKLMGVEAGGLGLSSGKHAAPLTAGSPGVLHGSFSYLMQDGDGQVLETHSVSAGLDYPGVGPEHSQLKDAGRVEYTAADDQQALDALQKLARLEGIICAFESAHAFAPLFSNPAKFKGQTVLVNLSGRGDKDMETAARLFEF